jgi:exopolyphosphatase/guanosine-5'-triphosphate,3'-diphosphate pyrophosphatase
LTTAIERAAGLKTEILSGAREADWVFRGVATDAALAPLPLLLIEVGGGSTEFILGRGRHQTFAHSFPLGTVRFMEKFPHRDPPTDAEFQAGRDWVRHLLQAEVRPRLEPALAQAGQSGEVRLVGTGGTTSILARIEKKLDRFDRDRIDGTVLNFEQVVAHRQNLWRLPLAARREIPGLPKLHADVILPGILIYEAVMAEFGFQQLRISTRGLRFGAVMGEEAG